MTYYIANEDKGAYLVHHGVPRQKKGVRRYQYLDGSLTPLGREHYGVGPPRGTKKVDTESGTSTKEKKKSNRTKAVKSGKVSAVKKNFTELSDDDINKALKRVDKRKKLTDMIKEQRRDTITWALRNPLKRRSISEVVKRGNPREIRARMAELTTEEVKAALSRAELNTQLKELYNPKDGKRGALDTIVKVATTIGTVADNANKVKNLIKGKNNSNSTNQKKNGSQSDNFTQDEIPKDELIKAFNALTRELSAKTKGTNANPLATRTAELNNIIAESNRSVKEDNQKKAEENREKKETQRAKEVSKITSNAPNKDKDKKKKESESTSESKQESKPEPKPKTESESEKESNSKAKSLAAYERIRKKWRHH